MTRRVEDHRAGRAGPPEETRDPPDQPEPIPGVDEEFVVVDDEPGESQEVE